MMQHLSDSPPAQSRHHRKPIFPELVGRFHKVPPTSERLC